MVIVGAGIVRAGVQPPEGDVPEIEDVCVLAVEQDLPGYETHKYVLLDSADSLRTNVNILGFPLRAGAGGSRVAAETFGDDGRGLGILKRGETSESFERGFSGAAVVSDDLGDVLGMVVIARRVGDQAFMIPVALLDEWLREFAPEVELNVVTSAERRFSHITGLRNFASEQLAEITQQGTFGIDVALCNSYEQIMEIHRGATVDDGDRLPPEFFAKHNTDKGLYLQAPGGFGKTSFLMRLLLAVIRAGKVPFYLDASRATSLPADEGEEVLRILFDKCTIRGSFAEFTRPSKDPGFEKIVIIDGLNENLAEMSRVIHVVDFLFRNFKDTSVYVADRMSRRTEVREETFQLATVLPINLDKLPGGPIREALKQARNPVLRKLLSTPFFLSLYLSLRSGASRTAARVSGRAGMLRAYFEQYVSANPGDGKSRRDFVETTLQALSKLAIDTYRTQGLHLCKAALEAAVGSSVVSHLVSVGVLVDRDEGLAFRQQLLHDFLAAFWLAHQDRAAWRQPNFDAATLANKSADVLELAAELLEQSADEFIIEVYDWNYSAALDCVLNFDAGMSGRDSPLPIALKDAIFAMVAEKQFDPFRHTRNGAKSRAEHFTSGFGIQYCNVRTLDQLIEQVKTKYSVEKSGKSSQLYEEWARVFTSGDDSLPRDWGLLQDSPLLAWTAANVFRRSAVRQSRFVDYLIGLYSALRRAQPEDERALAARWRIVHVLGASDEPAAADLLERAMIDYEEGHWVRYGAVRSLVEVASRRATATDARKLLDKLIATMGSLPRGSCREACSVALLAEGAPDWWAVEYGRVLKRGAEIAHDPVQPNIWEEQIKALCGARPDRKEVAQ